jgi:hypothetical protein
MGPQDSTWYNIQDGLQMLPTLHPSTIILCTHQITLLWLYMMMTDTVYTCQVWESSVFHENHHQCDVYSLSNCRQCSCSHRVVDWLFMCTICSIYLTENHFLHCYKRLYYRHVYWGNPVQMTSVSDRFSSKLGFPLDFPTSRRMPNAAEVSRFLTTE